MKEKKKRWNVTADKKNPWLSEKIKRKENGERKTEVEKRITKIAREMER